MTTRDPRFRDPVRPDVAGNGRERTQSLAIDIGTGGAESVEESRDEAHPSLALGTHQATPEDRTKVDSPAARSKTPAPPRPKASTRPPAARGDDAAQRLGTVLGSYKVLEVVGKGGMGYVYRAEHVKLGREVALKLLRGDYAKRKDAVARFIQEARTVNRIRHRNIVDVPDIIELDDGTTCIVMEFLRGQSLGAWARSGVELPRALAVLVQICDGLAAAHAVDIVHRDLKPDNIIVVAVPDGTELVKLLDFGVAKLLHREDEDVGFQTAAGSVIGTPAYMSPEQAGGMTIDARSDIYSLGAIMYELFCGHPMFKGRSFGEYVRKHLTEMPVPPRHTQGGANIDERLEAVILRALEKDPNRRYGHIRELRDSLMHLLGALETLPPGAWPSSTPRPPVLPPVLQPPTPAPTAMTVVPPPQAPSASHSYQVFTGVPSPQTPVPAPMTRPALPTPWWMWAAGAALAVALGVGAAVWVASDDGIAKPAAELTPPTAAPDPATLAPTPAAAAPTPATTEPTPPVATAPEPTPVPPAPAAPVSVDVRFDSFPSASVYWAGHSAELCTTPCLKTIDLRDGGPTDKRTFVFKAKGYKDAKAVVDLTSAAPTVHPTLEQIAPPAAATTKPTRPARPARPSRPVRPKTDPDETAPPKTDKGGKIDRTDTLDPFKSKGS